jgi:hypothetical protein
VAVFSTAASAGSTLGLIVRLDLMSVGSGRTSDLFTDATMNRGDEASDFEEEHGKVRVVVLEEGAYCFYPFAPNSYARLEPPIPWLAFRVEAGTVTYVGSFLMTGFATTVDDRARRSLLEGAATHTGSVFMNSLTLTVRDRGERDMALALAAQPGLVKLKRTTALAQLGDECPEAPTVARARARPTP